jgi:colicin import membrane protein
MLRKHENSDSWKAGALAILVHAVLLVAMLISFNWKAAHTVLNVTEVELWDKVPAPKVVETPQPEPKPVIEQKPEPKPIVEEKPKPEEPKVDIELEKKKKELEQKNAEEEKQELIKKEKEEKRKKLAQEMREEDLREKKDAEKKKTDEKLRKVQEDMLNENGADDAKASSAANASLIGKYTEKIKAKIRGNVTGGLCGAENPVIKVSISILPTGELKNGVRITKKSGIDACDEAVERAILASEPFELPDDAKLKVEFRDLNLTINPNN